MVDGSGLSQKLVHRGLGYDRRALVQGRLLKRQAQKSRRFTFRLALICTCPGICKRPVCPYSAFLLDPTFHNQAPGERWCGCICSCHTMNCLRSKKKLSLQHNEERTLCNSYLASEGRRLAGAGAREGGNSNQSEEDHACNDLHPAAGIIRRPAQHRRQAGTWSRAGVKSVEPCLVRSSVRKRPVSPRITPHRQRSGAHPAPRRLATVRGRNRQVSAFPLRPASPLCCVSGCWLLPPIDGPVGTARRRQCNSAMPSAAAPPAPADASPPHSLPRDEPHIFGQARTGRPPRDSKRTPSAAARRLVYATGPHTSER